MLHPKHRRQQEAQGAERQNARQSSDVEVQGIFPRCVHRLPHKADVGGNKGIVPAIGFHQVHVGQEVHNQPRRARCRKGIAKGPVAHQQYRQNGKGVEGDQQLVLPEHPQGLRHSPGLNHQHRQKQQHPGGQQGNHGHKGRMSYRMPVEFHANKSPIRGT